MNQYKHVNMS